MRNKIACKLLKDKDENLVKWSYIDKLEKLQKDYHIRLANKLNSKHVNFEGQKMKTTLTAQTLSLNVAASLKYLCESENLNFKNCKPTAKFISIFNNIFDVCNSKSKFGREFKRPID